MSENVQVSRQMRNRAVGNVVYCDGTQARVNTIAGLNDESQDYWNIGQLFSIQVGETRVIGLLHRVETDDGGWQSDAQNPVTLHMELSGEVRPDGKGGQYFSSGISQYPHLGTEAHRIRKSDLQAIYASNDPSAVTIGALSQSRDIPAMVSVDALLSRHFAVVGTTGTGKSTAVTLLLHLIARAKENQRILILDPHNEYASAFGQKAHIITADTLDLPFWMLTLEELTQIIFRGSPSISEEVDLLRDLIPRAKLQYLTGGKGGIRKSGAMAGITADTPVPFRFADLTGLIEDDIGSLDASDRRAILRRLRFRLDSASSDPRFRFLFGSHDATDRMSAVLGEIFRLPIDDKPITVFQLSGIPSEVVNSVASVLCRLAFKLAVASNSAIKTLVVCEEAHRYIPADKNDGFEPTRKEIARIAKEGRKYGVSLAVVTQRPNELDPTILSQCNTIFSLRLGNDLDQDVMRKAISNSSRSSLAFLSSLADRECIAFGSAVPTPMRMTFRTLKRSAQPQSANVEGGAINATDIERVVASIRNVSDADIEEEHLPTPPEETGRSLRKRLAG